VAALLLVLGRACKAGSLRARSIAGADLDRELVALTLAPFAALEVEEAVGWTKALSGHPERDVQGRGPPRWNKPEHAVLAGGLSL